MMKSSIAPFFLLASCVFDMAAADTSRFSGAFIQLGIGYESIRPTHLSSSLTINGEFEALSTSVENANDVTAAFSFGWYHSLNDKYLLGIGIDALPFASADGDVVASTQTAVVADSRFYREYAYSLFIAPAVTIGSNGLAYMKAGISTARVPKVRLIYNFSGYTVGLGYRHELDNGFYAFVEGNYANYGREQEGRTFTGATGQLISSSGTHSLESNNFLVGVGYSF